MRKVLSSIFLFYAMLASVSPASADPVRVTGGFIQVGVGTADWLFRTSTVGMVLGEIENGLPDLMILSGMPGDILNLSSSVSSGAPDTGTAFTIFDPERTDFFARVFFDFTAGDVTVPAMSDVLNAPGRSVTVGAPFAFTGSVTFFASRADQLANTNPTSILDLFGSGTAATTFVAQTTGAGVVLPSAPLVSGTVVYQFEDQAPVPEPGTLLLLGTGIAGGLLRRLRSDYLAGL